MPTSNKTKQTEQDTQHHDTNDSTYNINQTSKTAELVAFAHASFFSPAHRTLQQALKCNYVNHFPGLTAQALCNHPPQSVATVKGHLDQSHKNQRSTKPTVTFKNEPTTPEDEQQTNDNNDNETQDNDFWPTSEDDNNHTHHCFIACTKDGTTGKIFTDQTGHFIIPSSTRYTQLFILYDYDSNSIHAKPIKNKSALEILQAFNMVHTMLTKAGLWPKLQGLNNECSTLLAEYMTKQGIDYQLVPVGQHHRNAAERTIRTFKNHFVVGLCTTDKNFPLHLWDKLIPQAILTLTSCMGIEN